MASKETSKASKKTYGTLEKLPSITTGMNYYRILQTYD